MTPKQLDSIVHFLKQNHPAFLSRHHYESKLPYLKISEAEFDKKVNYLKDRISAYSDTQVNCAMCNLFASLGDAHTSFLYPRQKPIDIGFIKCGNGVYLSKVDKDFEDKLLSRVISIDGQDIEHLQNKGYALISSETKEWTNYSTIKNLSDPGFLAMLGVRVGENIAIKFADDDKVYDIPTKSASVSMPAPLGHRYFYEVTYKDDIPIIRYEICKSKYPNWDKFISDLNSIRPNSHIVVDLRGNDGGDTDVFDDNIINVIKEKNLSGVALVDSGTFSSGLLAALNLKELGFTWVGEKLPQSMINYGGAMFFENFQGKYNFKVTTELYNLKKAFNLPNQTNRPDEPVCHTIKALQEGRDLMLERAIELCYPKRREK